LIDGKLEKEFFCETLSLKTRSSNTAGLEPYRRIIIERQVVKLILSISRTLVDNLAKEIKCFQQIMININKVN